VALELTSRAISSLRLAMTDFMKRRNVARHPALQLVVTPSTQWPAASESPSGASARKTLGILLLPALLTAMACTSKPTAAESGQASLGQSSAGQRSLGRPSGAPSGQSLPPAAPSARAIIRESLGALKPYFDAPPNCRSGQRSARPGGPGHRRRQPARATCAWSSHGSHRAIGYNFWLGARSP
jgi:hypothetical protein